MFLCITGFIYILNRNYYATFNNLSHYYVRWSEKLHDKASAVCFIVGFIAKLYLDIPLILPCKLQFHTNQVYHTDFSCQRFSTTSWRRFHIKLTVNWYEPLIVIFYFGIFLTEKLYKSSQESRFLQYHFFHMARRFS